MTGLVAWCFAALAYLIAVAGSVTSLPRPQRRRPVPARTLHVTLPCTATSIEGRQIAPWDSGLMPAIHLDTKDSTDDRHIRAAGADHARRIPD